MSVERKWVYWHRVIHVEEWAKDDIQIGSLLGLKGKDTGCMKMVWSEETKSFNLKMYCKLRFLGMLLRTAKPEEVVKQFGPAVITIQPNFGCDSRKEPRGGTAYCTFKGASNRSKRLLCDANFREGRCPAGLKLIPPVDAFRQVIRE